jgi:outer membrane protein OmpA-like peptidoglycan-associated protein
LFGSDVAPIDQITNIVTAQSGIGLGSASTLMKMTASTLMSTIGSYIKNQSLDPVGLNRLLVSQKEIVKKAAPEGLFDKLGFSLSQDEVEDEEETKVVSGAPGTLSKVVPWIILIATAFGLFYFMRSCGGRNDTTTLSDEAGQEVTDSVETQLIEKTVADSIRKTMVDAESAATRSSEGGIVWIKFPDGQEIEITEGSFFDQLYKYLSGGPGDVNTRFTFDNLVFQTGSSNIAPSSMAQLQTISSLMQAYPDMEIRVEGHTDNAGDPTANKLLSEQRALAVKFSLTELGIANHRIQTAGYGDEVPLESNDTEAGRRMNRRVDVFVLNK